MKKYIYTALFLVAGMFALPHISPVQASMAGDLNSDGIVNGADLGMVLGAWGTCPTEGDCPEDLDGDGEVNQADVDTLLALWTPTTKPAKQTKSADLSGNGTVDGEDLGMLLGAWGTCPTEGNCSADLNSDDIVGMADQKLLLAAWSTNGNPPVLSATQKARLRSAAEMSLGTESTKIRRERTSEDTRELSARRQEVAQYAKTIKERLSLGAVRINTLIERTESRIEKLKAQGVNTSVSEKSIATAKSELGLAREAIATLPNSLTNTDRASLLKTREAITRAKEHLQGARRALVDAISSLKPGLNSTETN